MTPQKVFYDLCRRCNSPYSLGLWLRFRFAPLELANAEIDPRNYSDPGAFARDYACYHFLRKFRGLETGTDLRARALLSFGQAEEKCARTNSALLIARTTGRLDQTGSRYLTRVQELIAAIWGRPTFDALFRDRGWGPGATSSLKGYSASREDKMSQFPVSVTPAAEPYFSAVIKDDVAWLRHLLKQDVWGPASLLRTCFQFSGHSRVLTVPKDAKTDRTIAAEPTANIYLQKGIGSYLRKRLMRYGVNLNDQTGNQNLARDAYIRGLATLDLSQASDTISIEVVRLLCPPDMFRLLNRLRSPAYRLNGGESVFHKFSSMGNGFTFELESLIFFAVSKAVSEINASEKPVGVYGDDIVIGADVAAEVIKLLEDLGFSTNKAKSFIDGDFFESCGKHYFKGEDVTPPIQKQIVDCDLEYIRMANRFSDWLCRDEYDVLGLRKAFGGIHSTILRNMPETLRRLKPFGPQWLEGDGFFRVLQHDCTFKLDRGYKVRYLKPRPPAKRLADGGLYADRLRSLSRVDSKELEDGIPTNGFVDLRPRERVKRYSVATRWVPAWVRTAVSN
jgi:hypothetical protein